MDISSDEDERTPKMVNPFYGEDASQASAPVAGPEAAPVAAPEAAPTDSGLQQEETSKSAEKNQAEILQKLEAAFRELSSPDDLEAYLALHSRMRVMVSIEKLLELLTEKCAVCGDGLHISNTVNSL